VGAVDTSSAPATLDLDAYADRIGYAGERTASLATLRALHLAHPQAIPFENLDPLLGITPALELPALASKLLHAGRGGYCFEHNVLFRHVLDAIGFRVTGLAARVVWGAPPGATAARTHMLLRVDLPDGAYIADVGFGGLVLTAPLRLTPDIEQTTPHETFRLTVHSETYQVEVRLNSAWQPLYRFDLLPQQLIDYQVANWYVSTFPRSIFVTGIMMARVDGDRRYALRNTDFAIHDRGRTERRTIATVGELRDIVAGPFAIALPDHPGLDAALQRVLDGGARSAGAR